MKYRNFFSIALLTLTTCSSLLYSSNKVDWNFFTYIQADNNLAPFAAINVRDMQKVGSTSNVNILVQWDKPSDNMTYRYKILQNNMVLNSSINQEMGFFPEKELTDSMTWVKKFFSANRYALILWDHGNGVLDRSKKKPTNSWLGLPGISKKYWHDRGILYDFTQNTFLDNVGLSSACTNIKQTIGQNIDFLGTDACLMAMIEIAYQVKNSVNYLVASQELEPGLGWPYADILSSLVGIPTMSTKDFTTATVQAYSNFYETGDNADTSYTLSAIDVTKIQAATTAFNAVLKAITQAQLVDKTTTNTGVKLARTNTLSFAIDDYVDLIDLYDNLTKTFTSIADANNKNPKSPRKQRMVLSAKSIVTAVAAAKIATQAAIVSSMGGSDHNGKAHGLSIYYPANCLADASYKKTDFAQQTNWLTVLNSLR